MLKGHDPGRAQVRLHASLLGALAREAQAHAPRECCGALLAAAGNRYALTDAVALPNAAAGTDAYRIPAELLRVLEPAARARGLVVSGFYHSHPGGDAVPSARDLEAAWPGYIYLVVPLADAACARAWRLADDRHAFLEHDLEVVP